MTSTERDAAVLMVAWLSAMGELGAVLGEPLPVPAVVALVLDELGDSRAPQQTLAAVH